MIYKNIPVFKFYLFFWRVLGYKIVATHSGTFHADDVFAISALQEIFKIKVIRTIDKDIFSQADMRVDVGNKYDYAGGNFDHHQKGFNLQRSNGIPYASFGLMWKHFGVMLSGSKRAADIVEQYLVSSIDAHDCGYEIFHKIKNHKVHTISYAISLFNPSWQEKDKVNDQFKKSVKIAGKILNRQIIQAQSMVAAREVVYQAAQKTADSRIIILPQDMPWIDVIVKNFPKALYVIFPNNKGNWTIRAVPEKVDEFVYRKPFPCSWAALRYQELDKVTGLKGGIFCHARRFTAYHSTRQGAVALAELSAKG